MNKQTLIHILTDELKANQKEDRFDLPEGTRLTVFLAAPGSAMGVGKVTGFTIRDQYIILQTEEARAFTDLSEIMAIRVDEEAARTHKLGFGA
jgi:hypothetical protein